MQVRCPGCAKKLKVSDNAMGKKAKCPACNEVFRVTAADVAAVSAVPKPAIAESFQADEETSPPPRRLHDHDVDEEIDVPRGGKHVGKDVAPPELEDYPAGPESVQSLANTVAKWLNIASFSILGYFVIFLVFSFLLFSPIPTQGKINLAGPSPTMRLLYGLIGGLIILGPCLTVMLLGAKKAQQLQSRKVVLGSLIIAVFLGSLVAIGIFFRLLHLLGSFQILFLIDLLLSICVCSVLMFAGIKGLLIMRRQDMKEAFGSLPNSL